MRVLARHWEAPMLRPEILPQQTRRSEIQSERSIFHATGTHRRHCRGCSQTRLIFGRISRQTFLYFQRPFWKPLRMSSKISPCCFWDEIPTQPSSISRTVYRNSSKCLQRSHHVLSGTKSPPNLPLFPHGPAETRRSLAEKDRVRRGPTTPGRKPGGSSQRAAATPGEDLGKLAKWRKLVATKSGAKGGGNSRRKPAEARKGRRRLLGKTWGS